MYNHIDGDHLSIRVVTVTASDRVQAIKTAFKQLHPDGIIQTPPRGTKKVFYVIYCLDPYPSEYYLLSAVSVAQVRAYMRKEVKRECTWVEKVKVQKVITRKVKGVHAM